MAEESRDSLAILLSEFVCHAGGSSGSLLESYVGREHENLRLHHPNTPWSLLARVGTITINIVLLSYQHPKRLEWVHHVFGEIVR